MSVGSAYPVRVDATLDQGLSRWLWLVKWFLAIPQYLVVGVFAGGGTWAAWQTDHRSAAWGGGLIGLLVLVAAVVLSVTGRYPGQLFDFVLGLNRWVLRVAAYAALMTDRYPPFRLDMGGHESGPTMTLAGPPPAAPAGDATWATPGPLAAGPPQPAPGWGPPAGARRGWTAWRVASVVIGSLAALASVGLLAAGGAAAWLDNTQRDAAGYLTSDTHVFTTPGHAITSDRIDLGSSDVAAPADFLGTVRFHVTSRIPGRTVFAGIAPRASAEAYLAGVSRAVITDWATGTADYGMPTGGAPATTPSAAHIWVASASGPGTQTLTWNPTGGDWLLVVMNSSAAPGVSVTADAGVTMPSLGWIAGGLFIAGGLLLIAGAVLIAVPLSRVGRS